MSVSRIAPLTALALATGAFATVTPTSLFGDSYTVIDGVKTYAVLDVYIKGSSSADIVSSLFGVTAYTSAYTLNNGKTFKQSNGTSNSSWLPTAGATSWDSFVTCGARDQASAGTLNMQLDTNWASGDGSAINSAASTGGPGWYPAIGASTTTNPYARVGYYSGTGADNTAKATVTVAGNGIAAGASLSNHWMIGRFAIDITGDAATNNQLTLKFAVAGKQNGTTTFTGATSSAGRFQYTLTFVPAPGAAALIGLAGLLGKRRRNG